MTKINQTILMTGVDYFSDDQAINPFMDDAVKIDREEARKEHEEIKQAFEAAGIKVIQKPPPKDCQDGVYTANWALIRGDKAVMGRLPNARKGEEAYAAQVLTELGKTVIKQPEGLKFSGQGDALPCGDLLFCGQGYRADEAAQKFAAEQLGFRRIQLQTRPLLDGNDEPAINPVSGWSDSYFYDIDIVIAVLRGPSQNQKALIAWCPEAFTPESREFLQNFDEVDKIEVTEEEVIGQFACNLVSTGETVIVNAGATNLIAKIEQAGLKVLPLSDGELTKGGGSIRCTSLTLDNA